jgi:hypothetical protein
LLRAVLSVLVRLEVWRQEWAVLVLRLHWNLPLLRFPLSSELGQRRNHPEHLDQA